MSEGTFTGGQEQLTDWLELHRDIEKADQQIPCTNYPEAYFDEEPGLRNLARSLCESCPVQLSCLRYALKWEPVGMWGGLSAAERKDLLRARKALA